MSNSVNPAISRVGVVSGPAKSDGLTQSGNKAGDNNGTNNRININGLLKEKKGNNEESQDTGDRAASEDTTDKGKTSQVSESMQDKVINDAASQASQSRFKEMMEKAENFQPQQPPGPDPSMMGQNQGIDPAMLAGLMGKGQQGGGQQGGGGSPKPSQPSNSGQAKEQMQKMSDKFTDALKERDAKIKELADKVKENKEAKQGNQSTNPSERTEPGGLGSDNGRLAKYESLIDKMSSNSATNEEKAAAKQEMLAMTNQNLLDQISPESKAKLNEEFGSSQNFKDAYREAKQESLRGEESIAEYDNDSFAVSDLIKRDSDIFANSRAEEDIELEIEFEDEEVEIPDLDIEVDID